MTQSKDSKNNFDVIIAGGGLAGGLAAARIRLLAPEVRIGILEKQNQVGGRLARPDEASDGFGEETVGMNFISSEMLEFLQNTCSALEIDPGLIVKVPPSSETSSVAVVAGGKRARVSREEFFSPMGARYMSAKSSMREWTELQKKFVSCIQSQDKSPVHRALGLPKTGSTNKSLQRWGEFLGVSRLLLAAPESLQQRAEYYSSGSLVDVGAFLSEVFKSRPNQTLYTNCQIVATSYSDQGWELVTGQGKFTCQALVVAQSPWEANRWLDPKAQPATFKVAALKTQPVSLLVLKEFYSEPVGDLDSFVVIAAEAVRAVVDDRQIYFQVALDYEESLNAPEVVKAYRRIKRAKIKLAQTFDLPSAEQEHLALVPSAWTQSALASDRKTQLKMDPKLLNSPDLSFCGDAYGTSYHPDRNLIRSVLSAASIQLAKA